MNPRWDDLAKDWGNQYKPDPAAADALEIARPVGKNAGLRDDVHVLGAAALLTNRRQNSPFPIK
jgi:hypothetical protein